jgi:manganese-dependent inorganic pyrophosphatase
MKTYLIGHQQPDLDSVASVLLFTHIFNQKKCFGYPQPIPAIPGPINPETKTILQQLEIDSPKIITAKNIKPEDKIILIDHNEKSQRLPDINPDQIVEIIDHHKPNLNLSLPIFITIKAWGATATIVWYLAQLHSIKLPPKLQKLAAAAIVSDTIYFKSCTTTNKDQEAFKNLVKSSQISNPDDFAMNILKAKSDLSSLSTKEVVLNDSKLFNFANQKVRISVVETVNPLVHLNKLADYLQIMTQLKQQENLNYIFLCIVDIFNENTQLVYLTEKGRGVLEKAFSNQGKNNLLDIGKKLSRKKEIAPPIEKILKS